MPYTLCLLAFEMFYLARVGGALLLSIPVDLDLFSLSSHHHHHHHPQSKTQRDIPNDPYFAG